MATKYIENIGTVAGDAATALSGVLKNDTAGNVVPFVCDAVDGIVKYYDRVNSIVRQQATFNNLSISATASSLTVTAALHAGRTILLNLVGGIAVQLPLATGTGNKYSFIVGTASNANVLSTVVATDDFNGGYFQADSGLSSAVAVLFIQAGANDNTYSPTTLGGGGLVGDTFSVTDIATGEWLFEGVNQGVIDPTTRYSAV